ncbi:MAG: hypothetical protein WAO56_01775 [Miniphocaeibacter sp.]|uniref:hypothetical protein n=1 Tax=Miniphocaeibacter sp. TaxID=3100973 RepID=UPI003BAF5D56
MNKEILDIAINNYIENRNNNPSKYKEDYLERTERKKYYQSYTKEKIRNMDEE